MKVGDLSASELTQRCALTILACESQNLGRLRERAAATFAAEKLAKAFGRDINDLIKIKYNVTGTWDDPKIKILIIVPDLGLVNQTYKDFEDYDKAKPFRKLASEWKMNPSILAHRYALSVEKVSSVILGVKNRAELLDCIEAESLGELSQDQISEIDTALSSGSSL